MIFVTVGTHEQQFNRLVKCIDELKRDNIIQEEVIIQTGFSTYEPSYCKWNKLLTYGEMSKYILEARIVITHGGPSSFIMPLQLGKIPIVVPRKKIYDEHINDHQVEFVNHIETRMMNIISVTDLDELSIKILNYDAITKSMKKDIVSNNVFFNMKFEEIVEELFCRK